MQIQQTVRGSEMLASPDETYVAHTPALGPRFSISVLYYAPRAQALIFWYYSPDPC